MLKLALQAQQCTWVSQTAIGIAEVIDSGSSNISTFLTSPVMRFQAMCLAILPNIKVEVYASESAASADASSDCGCASDSLDIAEPLLDGTLIFCSVLQGIRLISSSDRGRFN